MHVAHIGRALLLVAAISGYVNGADLKANLKQAQELLDQQDYCEAIAVLERSLPEAQGSSQLLELLRHAYRGEIRRLVATEDRQAAQKYLERLRLIEQSPAAGTGNDLIPHAATRLADESVKVIMPDGTTSATLASDGSPSARLQGDWKPASKPVGVAGVESSRPQALLDHQTGGSKTRPQPPATQRKDGIPSVKLTAARPANPPPAATVTDTKQTEGWIKQADALFLARCYAQAGELYAKAYGVSPLALNGSKDRWAYCRLASVVESINSRPNSPDEWSRIHADISGILELIPGNEFARSLLAIAEREQQASFASSASDEAVIRANEPDRTEGKDQSLLAGLATRIGLGSAENSSSRSLWQRFRSGPWQVLETSNFRIHHTDENLAGPAADTAESTRIELHRTWYGQVPESNWSPKCDIFIHNSADQYSRATRQGPASPGHSQTGIDRGRIVSRRIDLRRDGADLIRAVLPHEITHVVLADRFTTQPMPRWADEGTAVLTEPVEKKQAHLRNLHDFARKGRLFTARQLMTMGEYPPGNLWSMFYAQSVSLVEFLVNRGGPAKFIEFMQGALRNGYEGELRRVYGFTSFEELDRQWSGGRAEDAAAAATR